MPHLHTLLCLPFEKHSHGGTRTDFQTRAVTLLPPWIIKDSRTVILEVALEDLYLSCKAQNLVHTNLRRSSAVGGQGGTFVELQGQETLFSGM